MPIQIPESRFDVASYDSCNEDPSSSYQLNAKTGNFVSNPGAFDNKFFNISPREARSMDPQQRILLHVAYEALENAGYVPDDTPSYQRDTFGCYVGVATDDYVANLKDEVDIYYSTGRSDIWSRFAIADSRYDRNFKIILKRTYLLCNAMERTFSRH